MPDKSVVVVDDDEVLEVPAETPQLTELVESDLLIEDVSIDGMCGVY